MDFSYQQKDYLNGFCDREIPPSLFALALATLASAAPPKRALSIALLGILNTGKTTWLDALSAVVPGTVRSYKQTFCGWTTVSLFTLNTARGPIAVSVADVQGYLFHHALDTLVSDPDHEIVVLVAYSTNVMQTMYPAERACELLRKNGYRVGLVGISANSSQPTAPGLGIAPGPQGDDGAPSSPSPMVANTSADFSSQVILNSPNTLLSPILRAYDPTDPPVVSSFRGGWSDALDWLGYTAEELVRFAQEQRILSDNAIIGRDSGVEMPGGADSNVVRELKNEATAPTASGFWTNLAARIASLGIVQSK